MEGLSLQATDFALFGLPERFALDAAALDATWKALLASAHPDRFATKGAAAQRVAMQWAIRINEAYRRLKDPLARAAYLCALHGADVGAEDNTAMPAAFLMQQMAWREALEDARDLDAVDALADEVAASRTATLASLERRIDGAETVDWPAVAAEVRGLMFVERFRADIDRRVDALSH
jgi:molecular chaperone HscB